MYLLDSLRLLSSAEGGNHTGYKNQLLNQANWFLYTCLYTYL